MINPTVEFSGMSIVRLEENAARLLLTSIHITEIEELKVVMRSYTNERYRQIEPRSDRLS